MTRSLAAREADVSTACAIASNPEPAITVGGAPTISSGSTSASRAATPGPRTPRFRPLARWNTIAAWLTSAPLPAVVGNAMTGRPPRLDPLAAEQRLEPLGRGLQGGRLGQVDDAAATDRDHRVRAGVRDPADEFEDGRVVRLAAERHAIDDLDAGFGQGDRGRRPRPRLLSNERNVDQDRPRSGARGDGRPRTVGRRVRSGCVSAA